MYRLEDYQFELPQELIAQFPLERRDHSRLLVIDREKETMSDHYFYEIRDLLRPGDQLIFNNTKVIPARLIGRKETGAACEIFLVKELELGSWEVLAKPGKRLKAGSHVVFSEDFSCEIVQTLESGHKIAAFNTREKFWHKLEQAGNIPLPQYIKRTPIQEDLSRYQTVYAKHAGAVAAPTAGLHFTEELLQDLQQEGVDKAYITLHVGLGTFKPVQTEDIRNHQMHSEPFSVSNQDAEKIKQASGRQVCVGTTTLRTLESLEGNIRPGSYETDIFIYPGYQFTFVKHLLTNFHLPGSTLLMLVSAFMGHEMTMEAYKKAVKDRYRFFSYGDAMLIL